MSEAERPLVTFALFTYNQEQFIRESLQSAFAQDYSPLEIVIVDDGSTDCTAGIIQSEVGSYHGPHTVKLSLKETNKGLADSVNAVIYELSQGSWLVFAAGDDISASDRCSRTVELAQMNSNITTIQGGVAVVDTHRNILRKRNPVNNTLDDTHRLTVCGAAAAYRRDAISDFPLIGAKVINEDFVLTNRALLKGVQAELQEQVVEWRRHEDNLTEKLSNTGRQLRRVPASLFQQISDISLEVSRGRIQGDIANRMVENLIRRINRHYSKANFNQARSSARTFLKYSFWNPASAARELLSILLSSAR